MHHHRTTLAAVLAALFALSISACGSSTEQDKSEPTAVATATGPVYIGELETPNNVTSSTTTTVQGVVKPAGANVTVNDTPVAVAADGKFSATVQLHRGANDIEIYGYKKGVHDNYAHVTVVRNQSDAEIQAERKQDAKQRAADRRKAAQRRVAARARHARYVANFKANAKTIPYNQLHKNADRYSGDHVRYHGQILQIQEEGNSGVMLLSVTNEGYDIWDDNVWVNYKGHVKGAEDDEITVYGTVVGSKEYDTQIGGSTYVPEINAKYIEE